MRFLVVPEMSFTQCTLQLIVFKPMINNTSTINAGYSNPPCVCSFLDKYKSKWSRIALFLGYDKKLIESLELRNQYCPEEQIRLFQRVWRVPDCGEQLEDILETLADCAELNSTSRPHGSKMLNVMYFMILLKYLKSQYRQVILNNQWRC